MALFRTEEYLERIRNTKARMAEAGIDVLIVSDPANMNYLTGYDGWSFYVPQAVVVSLDKEQPVWFGRGMKNRRAVRCAHHLRAGKVSAFQRSCL